MFWHHHAITHYGLDQAQPKILERTWDKYIWWKYFQSIMLSWLMLHNTTYARFAICCVLLWFMWGTLYPYLPGLLHWHCDNRMIVSVPMMWSWKIWAIVSFELPVAIGITVWKRRSPNCMRTSEEACRSTIYSSTLATWRWHERPGDIHIYLYNISYNEGYNCGIEIDAYIAALMNMARNKVLCTISIYRFYDIMMCPIVQQNDANCDLFKVLMHNKIIIKLD